MYYFEVLEMWVWVKMWVIKVWVIIGWCVEGVSEFAEDGELFWGRIWVRPFLSLRLIHLTGRGPRHVLLVGWNRDGQVLLVCRHW